MNSALLDFVSQFRIEIGPQRAFFRRSVSPPRILDVANRGLFVTGADCDFAEGYRQIQFRYDKLESQRCVRFSDRQNEFVILIHTAG